MIIDPNAVFEAVETSRKSGQLSDIVTNALLRYGINSSYPGYIEQFNTETGIRRIGVFSNGSFTALIELDPTPSNCDKG